MKVAEFFLSYIPTLIQLYARSYLEDDLKKTVTELENDFNVPKAQTYDFIIVGGGTAGCVLAGRLSEQYNVLLLEAGGNPPPAAAVNLFTGSISHAPNINYFFQSIPRQNTSGRYTTVTGKMMGGSGSHNQQIHNRGSPHDYDNWATLLNDSSWNYNNILPYFKRSETFIGKQYGPENDEKFYGKHGPISVQTNENPFLDLWLQAGEELGYQINDPNGYQTESFAPLCIAVNKGKRSSTYVEYVHKFENIRPNLKVIRYANVSEILLDENHVAYGVAFSRHNSFPQIAYASKEVILCAGTFSSPLLLMKSGIGPSEILQAAGIPVRLPIKSVGNNLNEHASVPMQLFTVNDTSIFQSINSSDMELIFKDFYEDKGLLVNFWKGAQMFKVSSRSEKKDWPDLFINVAAPVIIDNVITTASFSIVIGRPQSRGSLSLNTEKYKNGIRDDTQLALIDFNLLSAPDDIEALLEGVKFLLEIVEKTRAFQSVNMTYADKPLPDCAAYEFRSDDYWRCYIRQRVKPWTHMVGTCSMGTETGDSNQSVVDNKFRYRCFNVPIKLITLVFNCKVRGVKGLRVVDASVMPCVTNANINAPVIMLGEKAADEIKQYWSNVPVPVNIP